MTSLRAAILPSLAAIALAACSGSGGGSPAPAAPSGSGGGGTPPPPPPAATDGVGVPLAQGVSWTYVYSRTSSSVSTGGGGSSETSGAFRLSLGAPTTIQGRQAFPLEFEVLFGADPRPGAENVARVVPDWTHLAEGDDGALLGSRTGATLEPVYGPDFDNWTGGMFFADYADPTALTPTDANFDGARNSLDGYATILSSSDPFCEQVLGVTFCDDTSESYSETEFFVEGVGPWALEFFG
ncbi:MAG: hypothetical protein AAFR11_06640 [Pseudomonadota bacterium]